jgi:hypothetical protein
MSINSDQEKSPTKLLYSNQIRSQYSDPSSSNSSSSKLWGYDIPPGAASLNWFKLLLVEDQDQQEDIRNLKQLIHARETLRRLGKSEVEAVADYLRLLWNHAISEIERAQGTSAVEGLPFKVVLTVPAIWDHKAQAKMRQAAEKAGILEDRLCGKTTFELVSEPEAAALATLADLEHRPDIKVAHVFTKCTVEIEAKIKDRTEMCLSSAMREVGQW